ncbi:MAG: hypothetical protein MSC30_05200 [Gaiellaceae bacterium MAG52_C11]|nr:hypothetical protein [Candidatus Gaiellasilicea maunaloa]
MRPAIAIVAFAFGLLVVAGGSATAGKAGAAGDVSAVTVDLAATRQVIQGFGSSNRVWSDPHLGNSGKTFVPPAARAQILTALYGRLGLTRVRNVLDQGVQKAPGGRFEFGGKLADDHVAFVKQAKRFGLKTFFPGPVYLEPWMKPNDPAAYVSWAMAMLQRWRALGLEPALYAPLNEPEVANDFPPQWLRDVVVQLGARLRAAGFKTKLVIPDDENPRDAYTRAVAVLQDPAARQYVGALAYHVYRWGPSRADEIARMRSLASQYGLPVWMTEYSTRTYTDWRSAFEWAERMHSLLTDGGVNAIDYLWGYFGDWVRTDTMISIDFDNGVYRGHSATPLYWLTGQYSRYVRPGFARVAATPSSAGSVLTSAYKGPRRAIVVATNRSDATQTIRVTVTGGKLKGVVRPVRSSASEQWKSLTPISPSNGSFTAELPPQSITTFVATR